MKRENNYGELLKANIGWMFYRHYYHNLFDTVWAWPPMPQKELEKKKDIFFIDAWDSHLVQERNEKRVLVHEHISDGINSYFTTLKLDRYKNLLTPPITEQKPVLENSLFTTYPGLATGIGTQHETGEKGEFKLGLAFDHTTGLPFIAGQSVKGLLRSVFRDYPSFVEAYLAGIQKSNLQVNDLINEIFEGKMNDRKLSVYQRDIFCDAFVTSSSHTEGTFLGSDFITHHPTQFTDPNPVQFLKVLPNVVIQFNFQAKDNGTLSVKEKTGLFIEILATFGIGAKTNVGYGQLVKAPLKMPLTQHFVNTEAKHQNEHKPSRQANTTRERAESYDAFGAKYKHLQQSKKIAAVNNPALINPKPKAAYVKGDDDELVGFATEKPQDKNVGITIRFSDGSSIAQKIVINDYEQIQPYKPLSLLVSAVKGDTIQVKFKK